MQGEDVGGRGSSFRNGSRKQHSSNLNVVPELRFRSYSIHADHGVLFAGFCGAMWGARANGPCLSAGGRVGPHKKPSYIFFVLNFALFTKQQQIIPHHNAWNSFMSAVSVLLLCRLALSKTRRFDTLHDHEFNL